jgi:hypothetical protein
VERTEVSGSAAEAWKEHTPINRHLVRFGPTMPVPVRTALLRRMLVALKERGERAVREERASKGVTVGVHEE